MPLCQFLIWAKDPEYLLIRTPQILMGTYRDGHYDIKTIYGETAAMPYWLAPTERVMSSLVHPQFPALSSIKTGIGNFIIDQ